MCGVQSPRSVDWYPTSFQPQSSTSTSAMCGREVELEVASVAEGVASSIEEGGSIAAIAAMELELRPSESSEWCDCGSESALPPVRTDTVAATAKTAAAPSARP